jgi:hypothetical protein
VKNQTSALRGGISISARIRIGSLARPPRPGPLGSVHSAMHPGSTPSARPFGPAHSTRPPSASPTVRSPPPDRPLRRSPFVSTPLGSVHLARPTRISPRKIGPRPRIGPRASGHGSTHSIGPFRSAPSVRRFRPSPQWIHCAVNPGAQHSRRQSTTRTTDRPILAPFRSAP